MTIHGGCKVETEYNGQAASLTLLGGQLDLKANAYYDDWYGEWYTNYPSFDFGTNITAYSSPFGVSAVKGFGDFSFKTVSNSYPSFFNVVSGTLLFEPDARGYTHFYKIGQGELVFAGRDMHVGDWIVHSGLMATTGYAPFSQSYSQPQHSLTISNGAQVSFRGVGGAYLPIYMNGYGIGGTNGAIVVEHDGVILDAFLHLDSDTAIVVTNAADTVKLGKSFVSTAYSVISGPGSLTKKGRGTLELFGNQTNGMTTPFFLHQGTLALNMTQHVFGVSSHPMIIGNNLGDGTTAELKLLNQYQLPIDMPMVINDSGALNLNGFWETVGPITLQGGDIKTLGAVMYLSSDLLATNGVGSIISGLIHIGGVRRTFHIAPGYGVNITGQISDIGANIGFDVDGGGVLTLSGYNSSLFGPINVKAGVLYARNVGALGNISGETIIQSGARLAIDGRDLGAEPLVLKGDGGDGYGAISCSKTNTFSGPITLASDATLNVVGDTSQLILSGEVKGANGLVKVGTGTLVLAGSNANTYGGLTTVSEGVLQLSKTGQIAVPGALVIGDDASPSTTHFVRAYAANQFAPAAPVTIHNSGVLDISGGFGAQTIGSLAGSGALWLGVSTLTAGGNNSDTTFSGTMTGFAGSSLIKQGTGKLSLWSASPAWTGSTIINGGTLSLNGSHPLSPITINSGGILSGNGTAGPIVANNGKVMPGNSTGLLKSGNLALNSSSQFESELNGTNPGVTYDQLSVVGTVNLGDAMFAGKLGFGSAVSNQFVLILNDGNDPVSGKFKNLDEGATLIVGGAQFKITYKGGDGNDVVLIQTSPVNGPQVSGVEKLPDGNIQIGGTGFPNTVYKVEATQNLTPPAQWTVLGSVLSDALGKMQFQDMNATNCPMRFYRFVLP
jgi:autotransporter-associated beta strand protein